MLDKHTNNYSNTTKFEMPSTINIAGDSARLYKEIKEEVRKDILDYGAFNFNDIKLTYAIEDSMFKKFLVLSLNINGKEYVKKMRLSRNEQLSVDPATLAKAMKEFIAQSVCSDTLNPYINIIDTVNNALKLYIDDVNPNKKEEGK